MALQALAFETRALEGHKEVYGGKLGIRAVAYHHLSA